MQNKLHFDTFVTELTEYYHIELQYDNCEHIMVIVYNIIQSVNLLSDAIKSFNNNCLKGIKPNKKNINDHLNNSLMLVTSLNKSIGYDNAAKIAKKAYEENLTLKQAALKLNLISEKEFNIIVDPKKMI